MGFKYIMLEVEMGEHTSKMVPIIFPDFMIHQDLAKSIQKILKQTHKMESKVFSAGDISYVGSDCLVCTGRSETLEINANTEDTGTIRMYEYFHGIKEKG